MPVDVHITESGARELGGRLAGLSLPRQVYVLAIWPLLEQFMAFLVGMVDLMLAGNLTPSQIAVAGADALGAAGYVGWLMAMIHSSVGIGATALIARAVGGRHRRLANAALGQALLLALAGGVVIGAIVYGLADVVAQLAGLTDNSLMFCGQYLRIVAIASPASAILLVGNAALRGAGDTRSPFFIMVAVNVVNVAVSVLLVFGPAPFGGHSVAGIAAGTAIAWAVGAVMVLIVLACGWGGIRLHIHRLRPHWHTARRLIRIGVPSLFEGVVGMWAGNFLVLIVVGSLAVKGVVGAHMIAIRFESASFLPGFALGIAAATLCGQYLGLGDPDRAARAIRLAWLYAAAIMTVMGVLFLTIPHVLVGLVTSAPELVDQAVMPLRICGPIQIFFATNVVLAHGMRGAGDTRMPFLITAGSILLVRVPACYLAAVVFDFGLNGIWVALCAELTFRSAIFAWRFLHGGWAKVQV